MWFMNGAPDWPRRAFLARRSIASAANHRLLLGHTPRVGGRCESDPPGPDPEGISLRTARLRLLPLTSRDESDHARASRNAADALRDTRAADVQWREHGFGPWAVRGKQGSCFVGCAELRLPAKASRGSPPTKSRQAGG